MTGPITCPLEGCEQQFSTRNGAVMHMLNKPTHTEVTTKAEGYALLEGGKVETGQESDSSSGGTVGGSSLEESETSHVNADETPETSEGKDPTVETPPHETTQNASSDPALEAAKDGCPDCGGRMIDARGENLLKAEDGTMVDAPDDFYCSQCGRGFNWNA